LTFRGANRNGATFDRAQPLVHAIGALDLCGFGEEADVNAGVAELIGQDIRYKWFGTAQQRPFVVRIVIWRLAHRDASAVHRRQHGRFLPRSNVWWWRQLRSDAAALWTVYMRSRRSHHRQIGRASCREKESDA